MKIFRWQKHGFCSITITGTTLRIYTSAILNILGGALILMYPALWNRFPIITSDSGTYIQSSLDKLIPFDRPVFYGYFISWTDVYTSLWFVAFAQNILLSWFIWKAMQKFSPGFTIAGFYLTIIILVATTAVAWFSSQIIPDVFTPLLLLSVALILFDSTMKPVEAISYSAVAFFSCIVHFSHFMLATGLLFSMLILKLLKKKLIVSQVSWGRLCLPFAIVIVAIIFIPSFSLYKGGSFSFSKGSGLLFCSKLLENGLLKKYLDAHCGQTPNVFCDYRNRLPTWGPGFLYSSESPINQIGFDKAAVECKKLGFKIVTTYPVEFFLLSLKGGAINLFRLNAGTGIHPYDQNSSPYYAIQRADRTEFNQWLNSRQQGDQLNFSFLSIVQRIMIFGTFLILLFNLSAKNLNSPLASVMVSFGQFIILSLLLNAIITGALASEYDDRYQTRIAWLIPLIVFIQYHSKILSATKAKLERGE